MVPAEIGSNPIKKSLSTGKTKQPKVEPSTKLVNGGVAREQNQIIPEPQPIPSSPIDISPEESRAQSGAESRADSRLSNQVDLTQFESAKKSTKMKPAPTKKDSLKKVVTINKATTGRTKR